MKKIVISGSAKLQYKVSYWIDYFSKNGYKILDYPKQIKKEDYKEQLKNTYKEFYKSLEKTDTYFLMNEEKNGIKGYIGAGSISELTYVVMLNLIHNKNIQIYILNMPSRDVMCYDEVKYFLDMGWIKLFSEDKIKN